MGNPLRDRSNIVRVFRPKKYVCSRWPQLRLGADIQFKDGYLTATTQEIADRVERCEDFGRAIFEIKLKANNREPDAQSGIEIVALQELQQLAPQARKGMISTREVS